MDFVLLLIAVHASFVWFLFVFTSRHFLAPFYACCVFHISSSYSAVFLPHGVGHLAWLLFWEACNAANAINTRENATD